MDLYSSIIGTISSRAVITTLIFLEIGESTSVTKEQYFVYLFIYLFFIPYMSYSDFQSAYPDGERDGLRLGYSGLPPPPHPPAPTSFSPRSIPLC